ncbi:MAG: hypothetical protein IKE01_00855 [Clostridia bacterium]|nr:hypothetical protein [Clostridia bacterium]
MKSIIKNILLVGGVTVLTVGMLTGCGKKNDGTKTYDKENEVAQSIANNVNYAEKLSTEEKINIAYSLRLFNGDFNSTSQISYNTIISTLMDYTERRQTKENSVFELYRETFNDRIDESTKIYEYDEGAIKKAAKDLLNVDITESVTKFNDDRIKYNDGKYYYLDISIADGEQLTIKNISNDGNKYTFFALSALDSEEQDISEYTKYEAVIENGVIKSCKEAMNTENKTNDGNTNSNKNEVDTANEAIRKVLKDEDLLQEKGIYSEINDGTNTFLPEIFIIKIYESNGIPVYLVKTHVMDSAHTKIVTYKNGNVYVSKTSAGSDYCDEEVNIEKNIVKATNISAGIVTIYKIQDGEFEEIAEYETEDEASLNYPEDSFSRINSKLTDENIDRIVK